METNIRGRNVTITNKFQEYVAAKLEKLKTLMPKAQTLEVSVSGQNDKSPEHGDRVELTLTGPGPVIRAEATAGDNFAAFDAAYSRLLERVRRHKDKRRADHRRGKVSLSSASAHDFEGLDIVPADAALLQAGGDPHPHQSDETNSEEATAQEEQYSPVVIRSKSFPAEVLSAEAAVDRMELVGHDFFLFIDESNNRPSVVYRRKGWNYGVISLDTAA